MDKNLQQIINNESLMRGITEVTTPEEMMTLFKENNIELAKGLTAKEAFDLIQKSKSGELDEDQLEDVSGGFLVTTAVATVGCFVLAGAELAFIAGHAYETLRRKKKK